MPGFARAAVVLIGTFQLMSGFGRMVELAPRNSELSGRSGVQPIAIGAVALVLVLFGIGSIALYRGFSGNTPETDRMVAARQLQVKTAQVSEALVEKTKGLEATQQESIDQLQTVQDQLQTLRRQIAAQQADNKKLSEQIATLTEQIEGLRQAQANAQANEPAAEPSPRKRSKRTAYRKRHRSRG
jgi:uncharacterized protein YoxC